MRDRIQFENIQALRLAVGIKDDELRAQIEELHPGDMVTLTLPGRCSTQVSARITQICGEMFCGRLIWKRTPPSSHASRATLVTFAACHIHSIPRTRAR